MAKKPKVGEKATDVVSMGDQEFLAAIVRSSDDAIIGKDLDGAILTWNDAATKMYGFSEEQAIGRSIRIVVPPDREDEIPQILDKIGKGALVDHYETMRMSKDGRQFHVSLTVSPIRNRAGKIVGASTIARDISQRMQIEESMARQRLVQAILDVSIPVMQVWEGVLCAPLIGTLDSQRDPAAYGAAPGTYCRDRRVRRSYRRYRRAVRRHTDSAAHYRDCDCREIIGRANHFDRHTPCNCANTGPFGCRSVGNRHSVLLGYGF